MKLIKGRTIDLISIISIGVLLPCNLLFNIFNIFAGNLSEISVPLVTIYSFSMAYFIVIAIAIIIIGLILPNKITHYYITLLVALNFLIWIQSNIIVWDYGLAGKSSVDWASMRWKGWLDGALWLSVLAASLLVRDKIVKIASIICVALFCIQLVSVGVTSLAKGNIWAGKAFKSINEPNKAIFRFSSSGNIIHIILDELQSTVFHNIIDKDQSLLDELDGFTFFTEATGSFPTTQMSLPAFLAGEIYRNQEEIEVFLDRAFRDGSTIANVLAGKGYSVDIMYSIGYYHRGKYTNGYSIPVPYASTTEEYEESNSRFVIGLAIGRGLPHFVRAAIGVDGLGLLSYKRDDVVSYEAIRQLAHRNFLRDFTTRSYVEDGAPSYKFIHLNTTHFPAVTDGECNFTGRVLPWAWPNIYNQARCSLREVINLLRKFKELGIYDKAFIILQADHGYYKIPNSLSEISPKNLREKQSNETEAEHFAQMVCSALPTLAIKLPGEKGRMRMSKAHVSLMDIRPTIFNYYGIQVPDAGQSLFEVDESKPRERYFTYYNEMARPDDRYYKAMTSYKITGSAFDANSWVELADFHSPEESYSANVIEFGSRDSLKFLGSGWSNKERDSASGGSYIWAVGKKASISLHIPGRRSCKISVQVKTIKFPVPQTITLRVDGKDIARWQLSELAAKWEKPWGWEELSAVIPMDSSRPRVSRIEFIFSDNMSLPGDPRPLAALFRILKLDPI